MQNGEIEPERSEGYPKSYVDTTSGEINPLCAEICITPLTEQIRMQNGEIEPERSEGYPKSYVDTTSGEINPLCAEFAHQPFTAPTMTPLVKYFCING